jgi:hypothetical protein
VGQGRIRRRGDSTQRGVGGGGRGAAGSGAWVFIGGDEGCAGERAPSSLRESTASRSYGPLGTRAARPRGAQRGSGRRVKFRGGGGGAAALN